MYEGIVQDLIDEFGKLPGIGPKSAQRMAFFVVQNENYDPTKMSGLLSTIRDKVRFCRICGMISDQDTCGICSDARKRRPSANIISLKPSSKQRISWQLFRNAFLYLITTPCFQNGGTAPSTGKRTSVGQERTCISP